MTGVLLSVLGGMGSFGADGLLVFLYLMDLSKASSLGKSMPVCSDRAFAASMKLMRSSSFKKVMVHRQVDQRPVIQTAALHGLVGNVKAERPDEVQSRPRRRAGARDRARVVRDLGLHQNDIEHSKPPTCSGKRNSFPLLVMILSQKFEKTCTILHFSHFLAI